MSTRNKIIVLLLLSQLTLFIETKPQNIAINSTGNLPDTSAMLDISSTTKGLLAPRLTTTQQNAIPLPATGLLIFNTTDNGFKVNMGTPVTPVWTSLATGSGATTNTLSSLANNITSTTNGVAATAPIVNSNGLSLSGSTLTTTVNGVASVGLNLLPAIAAATTNTLSSSANILTNTTNGVGATAPIVNSVNNTSATNTLSTSVNGVAGAGVPIINSNTLANPTNTITSTVNGVTATAPSVNTVGNALSGSTLTTIVNGVASVGLNLSPAIAAATTNTLSSSVNTMTNTTNGVGATAPIVNSVNNTSAINTLSTSVNGVAGAGVLIINSNTLANPTNTITSTVNGITATAPSVNTVGNTSVTNTLKTIVNSVTSTGVPMINSNALSITGNNLTSTVNGVGSTALDISGIVNEPWYNVATGIAASSNTQNIYQLGNVGIGLNNPAYQLGVKDNMEIRRVGALAQLLFTNTGVTGDFRFGGDGGDIFWQGGGGRSLQMGSYWPTILGGDRLTSIFPAFVNGVSGTSVIIASQRDASVALGIQANSGAQTAHLTDWRSSNGTAMSVMDAAGNLGLGITNPTQKLHVNGQAIITTLNAGAASDDIVTVDVTGLLKRRSMASVASGATITSLNGLTNTTQTFAAGTAGSDFGISSSGTIHTFNLPTASPTNRGALSAADWNTFNGKQTALSGTGYTKFSGTTPSYISAILNSDLANSAITIQGIATSLGGAINIISGTGFVKATGTTISYDNSTYLTTTGSAAGLTGLTSGQVTTALGFTPYNATNPSAYITTAGARTAISLTTTGTAGAVTYNNATGVLNIPTYVATASPWALAGNSGITQPATPATYGTSTLGVSENFLGTTDAKDVVFATKNIERMRLLNSNGYLGIGTATPSKPIDLVQNLSGTGLVKIQNTNAAGYSSIDIWSNTTQVGNIGFSNGGASYPNSFYFATNTTNNMVFATNNVERIRVDGTNGNVGIGVTTPTAGLHIEPGTNAASTAPLKFTAGTNLSTPENGAVEYDGTNYFATAGGTRYTLAKTLTGTTTWDCPNTAADASSTTTVTVNGVVDGDVVTLGIPSAVVINSAIYSAYVSAPNTVTIKMYNGSPSIAVNPPSATYKLAVIKF